LFIVLTITAFQNNATVTTHIVMMCQDWSKKLKLSNYGLYE